MECDLESLKDSEAPVTERVEYSNSKIDILSTINVIETPMDLSTTNFSEIIDNSLHKDNFVPFNSV